MESRTRNAGSLRYLWLLLIATAQLVAAAPRDVDRLAADTERWQRAGAQQRAADASGLEQRSLEAMTEALEYEPRSPSAEQDAMARAEQAVATAIAIHGPDDPRTLARHYDAWRFYRAIGRATPAKRHLLRAWEGLSAAAPDSLLRAHVALDVTNAFHFRGEAWNRPYFEIADAIFTQQLGPMSHERAYLAMERGSWAMVYGRVDIATAEFERASEMLRAMEARDEVLFGLVRILDDAAASAHVALSTGSDEARRRFGTANEDNITELLAGLRRGDVLPCARGLLQSSQRPTSVPFPPAVLERCEDDALSLIGQDKDLFLGSLVDADLRRGIELTRELVAANADPRAPPDPTDLVWRIAAGRYEDAIERLEILGGFIVEAHGPRHPRVATYLQRLARLRRWVGEPDEAARLHRLALGILVSEAPTEAPAIAGSLLELGIHAARNGAFDEARRYFAGLEELQARSGLEEGLASLTESFLLTPTLAVSASPLDRARLYFLLGDIQRSRDLLEREVANRRERLGPDSFQTLLALAALADFHEAMNDEARALETYRSIGFTGGSAFSAISASSAEGSFTVLLIWARVARLEGRHEEAIEKLRASLAALDDVVAPTQLQLVGVHLELIRNYSALGRHEDTIEAIETLLRHPFVQGQRQQTALAQVQLAQAQIALGRAGEAVETLEAAITELSIIGNDSTLWSAEAAMSRALYDLGNLGAAVWFGKRAVNRVERIRGGLSEFSQPQQASFMEDKAVAYRTLADALIEAGDLAQAQQVVALLKAHEYDAYLTRGDPDVEGVLQRLGYTDVELRSGSGYETVAAELATLERSIRELRRRDREGSASRAEKRQLRELEDRARDARRAFARELATIREEFAALGAERLLELGERNLGGLGSLQGSIARLGDDVALVHYLVLPDKVRMIVTTPSAQTSMVREVDVGTLRRLVYDWREAVNALDDEVVQLGRALHELLVAPVEPVLDQAGTRTLMVSLDGVLRYLPIAALHDGEGYLAERYRVALFTPAAQGTIERSPKADWRVAAFGVSEGRDGFAPLPSVVRELDGIVREAENDDGVLPGEVLLDAGFTSARLSDVLSLEGDYPVVHIASHFAFVPGRESESFLLTGDGGLTIDDLQYGDFPLQSVDLLTLSACNSGLSGIDADGAEIEGLAALAQNKGAASVLATLWPVADESTGAFMETFYTLRSEGRTKAEALQATQARFLEGEMDERFSHPFFWAPFILMGNWL